MSECNELFVIKVNNNEFINNWKSLNTCRPGDEQNCLPNTLTFLNLVDALTGQTYSDIAETTGLTKSGDAVEGKKQFLGTALDFIPNYLTKNPQNTAKNVSIVSSCYDDYKLFFDFFNKKLNKNEITILNIFNERGMGHTLTIGKQNNGNLIILDPQQMTRYDGYDEIKNYLKKFRIISASVVCMNNELKRKLNELYSSIRKNENQSNGPDSKRPRRGGAKNKTKKNNSKYKKNKTKNKTKNRKKKN